MKTTSMRTAGAIFTAGILLTSCVSSKKYHRSQDEVAKLRQDSTTLAQHSSSLQQNLTATEQKNADLQKSVEAANSTNTGLQKNVAYYTDNVSKQKTTTQSMKGELTTTLSSAGLTDQDITQTDTKIFINIAEKNLFKGKSAVLSTKGKELVNNLGTYVKSHETVDVSVADLELANATASGTAMESGSGSTTTTTVTNSNMTSTDQAASSNTGRSTRSKMKSATNGAPADNTATAMKRKAIRHSVASHKVQPAAAGESKSVTYSSGRKSSSMSTARARRALAWQRQNAVANTLLQNGLPKVKLVQQNQSYSADANAQKGVQVVLNSDMDAFYKTMSEAPAGQPMGKNNP